MSTLASADLLLCHERPQDTPLIREINRAAFEGEVEARLVDALRAAGAVTLSAVAVQGATTLDTERPASPEQGLVRGDELVGGEAVGHVLFSQVIVATDKGNAALLGLGPVAVLPSRQRQGIGTLLIAGSLEYLRAHGQRGVVVVGDPAFYRRFGFIQAGRWGLRCELEVPDENFMALALRPGALTGVSGAVRYRPEFDEA